MSATFSIIHASRGRPQKAAATMRLWRDRAARPQDVEYILCADADDETRFDLIKETNGIRFGRPQVFVEHPGTYSAPAWDFAAKFSTGHWLVQASDDVVPPQNWDELLVNALVRSSAVSAPQFPTVIATNDGYRKDRLLVTAICNRARYEQQGEFLHAGFRSMYSDDDFTVRAYSDEEAGKCVVVDARDVVFKHENAYHTGAEQDETLKRQNSSEAYRLGSELFLARNRHLLKWRTWA